MHAYNSTDGTLAGLATGVPLSDADKSRLDLRPAKLERTKGADGQVEVAEEWQDETDLEVSVVNGLIFTVEADEVTFDGEPMTTWTGERCRQAFGGLVHTEELTDALQLLHLGGGGRLVYIAHGRFQSLSLIDPEWNRAFLSHSRADRTSP